VAVAGPAALVGRERESERVLAFCGGAGTDAKLLLEGEPGIGKTTLWQAGLDEARSLDNRVLEATPAASERDLSFAGLVDLLTDLHDAIGALPAPQRRALRIALLLDEAAGEAPDQRTIAVALTALLGRAAENGPVLVAVDDVQWLDPASSAALEFALRRLGDAPVRLLATARPGGGLPIDFGESQRLTVGPLPLEELDRLVRTRLDARLLRPAIREIAEASRGNPFYAFELAEAVLRSGKTLEPGERLPVPTHFRAITASRLEVLSPPAREATLAVAALAQPTVTAVAAIAGSETPIGEAVAAGVLERDNGSLRFTHPLFAASVYEDTPSDDRKAMHRRLAAVVTDPEERARQLAEGADGPDTTIATFVEAAAARVASRGAPHAAVRLAKLAVELTPRTRRNALHKRRLDCARYAFAAGDPAHAQELLEAQLRDAAPGRERAEVELELGHAALATDGAAAAMAHYECGLQQVEASDELELQALLLTELADTHLADLRNDSDVSARAVAVAEQVYWNPELLARALGVHGATREWREEPVPDEYWQRALEVERGAGQLRWAGPAHAYGLKLMFQLEYDEAIAVFRDVAASMRRRDDPMLQGVLLTLADIARNLGNWDEAAAYVEEAHDVVKQTGRVSVEPECLMAKARLAMLRGDLELADELGTEALAALADLQTSGEPRAVFDGPMIESLVTSIRARCAEMAGDHDRAHELFVEAAAYDRSVGMGEWAVETLAADVGSLVSLGRLDEADRALAELHEIRASVSDSIRCGASALADRAAGVLASARGELDVAIASLERSQDELGTMPTPWPYELGRTLLALGRIQRRARQKTQARATLARALEIFEQLGSKLWAEQAREELAQIGGRPERSGALTPTEARVAAVVAAGRSNADAARELFMSPKTVEWNLSKVYKKLHVRSRAELAAKLAREPHS
jgi:DNA-binding CsgD family transcriptional regulator